MDLTLSGYKEPDAPAFADRLRARVRALPGVQHASFAADLPLDGGRMGLGSLRVPGLRPPDGRDSFRADWNAVSPDYFKTLNMTAMPLEQFTGLSLIPQRIAGAVAASLGVVVLLLAAIGILRRDLLLGEQAHPRDRHPHGARSRSSVGLAAGDPAGPGADGARVDPMLALRAE